MAHFKVTHTWQVGSDRRIQGLAFTAVPGGTNQAGVPWTTVAQEYRAYRLRRFGGVPPVPLDPAVEADLAAGNLLEWLFNAVVPDTLTPAQTLQAIKDQINTAEAAMTAELGDQLAYWGFEAESV
jgi:hypothetical protein